MLNLLLEVPEELKFANLVIYYYVKVPSFPDDIAMALLEEELGRPWHEIYSELSPSPIAAASLGQVYKGRLKETGDQVAVKVQRPFVLETVTIDLFIIRKLGLSTQEISTGLP